MPTMLDFGLYQLAALCLHPMDRCATFARRDQSKIHVPLHWRGFELGFLRSVEPTKLAQSVPPGRSN